MSKKFYTIEFTDQNGDTRIEHVIITEDELKQLTDKFNKHRMDYTIYLTDQISKGEAVDLDVLFEHETPKLGKSS